jgi:hypothetical protein
MPLDNTTARADLLQQAIDCLQRVTRHDRWGCSAADYADQAAELLRHAGLPWLAEKCECEFGIDAEAVIADIKLELAR